MSVRFLMSVVFIFMFAIISGCGSAGSGPGTTVEKYYQAVESGKSDAALKLFSSKELEDEDTKKKLLALIAMGTEEIKTKDGIKSIEIEKEEIDGDSAKVTAKVTYGNGKTDSQKVKLIKEDGKWKLTLK